MSMGIIKGSKYVRVAGLGGGGGSFPKLDWASVTAEIALADLKSGYSAPAAGMIVGSFEPSSTASVVIARLYINNIPVAKTTVDVKGADKVAGNVQCPVSKDDIVKLQVTYGSGNISTDLYFVPFEGQ